MVKDTATIPISELVKDIKKQVEHGSLPRAICFDFFDTLVFRTVAPEQTKELAAHQLANLLGILSGRSIYEIRREVERKLCSERVAQGWDPEFSLPELAAYMYRLLLAMLDKQEVIVEEQEFIRNFCSIELAVEKLVQRPYAEMLDLLEWLNRRKVVTCLISDFYIPQRYFEMLLSHHGIRDLIGEIFISVDYGVTKGSGKLYEEVCGKLGCRPEELWMIGDNVHADKSMAEHSGIKAYLIDSSERKLQYERWQKERRAKDSRIQNLKKAFDQIIRESPAQYFPEMGSTLWLFITGLFEHLHKNHVTDVFFCSKEGEFLKRLFAVYQEKMFGAQLIVGRYLVVSRKATFICSLKPLGCETFSRLFDQYRDLTIAEFILSLNFSRTQLAELTSQLTCDCFVRIGNLQQHNSFKELLELPLFQQMYEQHRREQRHSFLTYLDSFGVDFRRNGLHLVDVGWKGSIQNNIYIALAEEVHVHGRYIGLLSPTMLSEKNSKTGILFGDYPQLTPFVHVYNNNRSLFEMILGASHGSADGYFTEAEYSAIRQSRHSTVLQSAKAGESIAVTVLDLPEERRLFEERIRPMQNAYLAMFARFTEVLIQHHCPQPDLKWFAECHARMLFRPTKGEVDFFAQLYHLENFGLFEFTSFDTAEKITPGKRLANFFKLRKNPAALLETGVWPPIIFRRLGLSWLQRLDGRNRYRRIFTVQQ